MKFTLFTDRKNKGIISQPQSVPSYGPLWKQLSNIGSALLKHEWGIMLERTGKSIFIVERRRRREDIDVPSHLCTDLPRAPLL